MDESVLLDGGRELAAIGEVVFPADVIAGRVREMGRDIGRFYPESERLLVLGLLKGSLVFTADLIRSIDRTMSLDFVRASSYGSAKSSSGSVELKGVQDLAVADQHILVVEDIVDSGTTLNQLVPALRLRGPRSVQICTLLHKGLAASLELEPRWIGFDAPNEFLVGYGLDHAEQFRNLPFIATLGS